MEIQIHPHASERMKQRGATEQEVLDTVRTGEQFPAKFGRIGFRRNFEYNKEWQGKLYSTKQIEIYAVQEDTLTIITVLVKFF